MFKDVKIKTFDPEDLVGRTIAIQSLTDNHVELIVAKDLRTGDLFVLKEIHHPIHVRCTSGK